MTKTYNDALEWAAQWIEDTLRNGPETNERAVEFGTNMAMTLRAAKLSDADLPRAAADDNLVAALAAVVLDESLPRSDGPCWCDDDYSSKGPHAERCQRIKELIQRAATPRAETGLSVEAALKDANELCRSALAIAKREGLQTNWAAFGSQLERSLKMQHEAMNQVRAWAKSRSEREGESNAKNS